MKRKRIISVLLAVLAIGLTVVAALAMSSANYRLDWTELHSSASGAGASSSTNYRVADSFGAPFVIELTSPNSHLELGYWTGYTFGRQFLPFVRR